MESISLNNEVAINQEMQLNAKNKNFSSGPSYRKVKTKEELEDYMDQVDENDENVLPNVLPSIIVRATLGISTAILDAAALGFLGLGVQPPAAEWGDMLGRGRNELFRAPWLMIFPGLAITLTVLAFNLLGDGVRDGRLRHVRRIRPYIAAGTGLRA